MWRCPTVRVQSCACTIGFVGDIWVRGAAGNERNVAGTSRRAASKHVNTIEGRGLGARGVAAACAGVPPVLSSSMRCGQRQLRVLNGPSGRAKRARRMHRRF